MDSRINDVIFNEEAHTYTYNGRNLHGVTHAIDEYLGIEFPEDNAVIQAACLDGTRVHKEVENYINEGRTITLGAARYVAEVLVKRDTGSDDFRSEVMVSDFETTASKIDIVQYTPDGAVLYDVKTTTDFHRQYCSIQLSIYKKLFEENYGIPVKDMYVIGTKMKRLFHILPQRGTVIKAVLELNKA